MSTYSEEYETLRSLGARKRTARSQALVNSVISDEREQREAGIAYSREHVNQATVHARQNLVLALDDLDQISRRLLSIRRWLAGIAVLFAALLLTLWA